jgi:Arc/MetJ-type ribon-helix-helix transcriptional regulator
MAMRLHITLPDALVGELDRRVGPRRRSSFIASAVRVALEDERRWEAIEAALGSIAGEGHEWDEDPAAWVRSVRQADARRVG